jgi:hypothetical protein
MAKLSLYKHSISKVYNMILLARMGEAYKV